MSDVFISYSRSNREFVLKLFDALKAKGHDAWVDWEDIEYAEDWWQKICAGIEQADNFVFVITPESARSKVCFDEIDYAFKNNKRIVPVLHREITELADQQRLHPAISKHNWLPFTETDILEKTFSDLLETIHRDPEHVRSHTRLLVRAREWEKSDRRPSLLLRGDDLQLAENWLISGVNKDPVPTDLHAEYIATSRVAERNYQRRILASVSIALLVAIGLSILSFLLFQNASDERNRADQNVTQVIAAQQTSDSNAVTATVAQGEAEMQATVAFGNLIESQNMQALVLADLAQQQLNNGSWQDALHLAVASVNMRDDGVINLQSYHALSDAVSSLQQQKQYFKLEGSLITAILFNGETQLLTRSFVSKFHLDQDTQQLTEWRDSSIQIWDVATGESIVTIQHEQSLFGLPAMQWNADKTRILTKVLYDSAQIWDVTTGELIFTAQHDGIDDATWNSDETHILTWSNDGVIQLWDVATEKIIFTAQHGDYVYEATWNSDETQILAWSSDGTVRIWDVATGIMLFTAEHNIYAPNPQWNHDETQLLTISADNTSAQIWDMTTGELIFTAQHNDRIYGATWNSDETQLLTWADDGTTRIWDVMTGQLVFIYQHGLGVGVRHASWHQGETQLLSWAKNNTVRVWDLASGNLIFKTRYADHIQYTDDIQDMVWNQAETQLLIWSKDGIANIWDVATGEALFTTQIENGVKSVEWNSTETQLLIVSRNNAVTLWDVDTGELLFTVVSNANLNQATWNSAETQLLTRNNADRDCIQDCSYEVQVWDIATAELLLTAQHEGTINGASWVANDSQILSWSDDGTARIWDIYVPEALVIVSHEGYYPIVEGGTWSADDTKFLTRGNSDDYCPPNEDCWYKAQLWDATTGELLFTSQHNDKIVGMVFNADETRLLTWSEDGSARVWDIASGEAIFIAPHQLDLNDGSDWDGYHVLGARWSADETKILTWSEDGTASIWDIASGKILFTAQHEINVRGATWNSDESQLLTWSWDDTAKLWDVTTGELLFIFQHEHNVSAGRWNANETQILTQSEDGTARIWDADTGELVFTAPQGDAIKGALWSTDETKLLTWAGTGESSMLVSNDKTARVWDITTGELLLTVEYEISVWGATWNAEGTQILIRGDNLLSIWDVTSQKIIFTNRYEGYVMNATWNSNETRILAWGTFTAQGDDIVNIWDATTGELLLRIQDESAVSDARWNADETLILTWGADTASIWNATTGELIFTVHHDDFIRGASWNVDETKLLTWSADGTARVWLLDVEQLLAIAEEKLIPELFTNEDRSRYFLPQLTPTPTPIITPLPTLTPPVMPSN